MYLDNTKPKLHRDTILGKVLKIVKIIKNKQSHH